MHESTHLSFIMKINIYGHFYNFHRFYYFSHTFTSLLKSQLSVTIRLFEHKTLMNSARSITYLKKFINDHLIHLGIKKKNRIS